MDLPAPINKNSEVYNPKKRPPCPFYGFNGMFGSLIDQEGNQCGLITDSYSPCRMEVNEKTPNWHECPHNTEENRRAIVEGGLVDMPVLPREFSGLDKKINLLEWAKHVMGEERSF